MPTTHVMLGGVPIVLHAGAPELSEEAIGGSVVLRMSEGAGQKMQHWQRMAGSISGAGWIPAGLDGLDYTQPLDLWSTQVNAIHGGLEHDLSGAPRPDVAPWADALIGDQWVSASLQFTPGTVDALPHVSIAAVPGATQYRVCWMPAYKVLANRPPKTQSSGTATHGWTITWEEA